MSDLGVHLLADLHGVAPELLADQERLNSAMRAAVLAAGATILEGHFHGFGPGQGVTGVLLLSESHCSIHTWPEHRLAVIDIFMCGRSNANQALTVLIGQLAPVSQVVKAVGRGQIGTPSAGD